ncbi:MAG TPA: hypothetical protein DHV12_06245 [Thermotogae bacterium]|nr:hypothetical protein [Thermotogota bacterium]
MNRFKSLVFLGLLVFVTVLIGIVAFSRFNLSSTQSLLPEKDPSMENLRLVKSLFPEEGILLCLLELKPNIRGSIFENKGALEEIEKLVSLVGSRESVKSVDSILEASKLELRGFLIGSTRYLEEKPSEMLKDPFYVGNIISSDGRITTLIVRLKEYDPELVEWLKSIELNNFEMVLTGQPVVDAELDRSVWILSMVYPPLLFLFICGIYYLRLRNTVAAALPPLAAVIAALWVYELVGILSIPVNILTATVGIFLIIITSAYGLHFVDRLVFHLRFFSVSEAVKKAIKEEWRPIFLSALTTATAFLSFLFTPLKAFRELGVLVSSGIFLSLIVVFGVIPWIAILVNLHPKKFERKPLRKWNLLFLKVQMNKRWRRWFLLVSLIVLVVSIWMIPRIEVNFDNFSYFRQSSQVNMAARKAIENLGWAVPLYVVVEKPSPFTVEDQKHLLDFIGEVENLKGVTGTLSALDFWRYYSIPLPLLQVFSKTTPQLSEFINGNALKIMVKVSFTDSRSFQVIADKIRVLSSRLPGYLQIHIAGEPLVMASLNNKILESQVISVVFTFLFIFAITLALFRKLLRSFLAVSPVLLTLIFNFFFMSATNIWLEISTSIVASILAGLVIDYSIHLMEAKNSGDGRKRKVVPVILTNSLGLMVGFLTLVFSPVALYARLGFLIAFGTIYGAFAAIAVLDG